MSDWFDTELGLRTRQSRRKKGTTSVNDDGDEYCDSCGDGDGDWCQECENCEYCGNCDCVYCRSCGNDDSDWCDDCDGCRFSECNTCTCKRNFDVTVTYCVTVEAFSEDQICRDVVHNACMYQGRPDEWVVEN